MDHASRGADVYYSLPTPLLRLFFSLPFFLSDPELFCWLEDNMEKLLAREPAALGHAIKRSCENKAEIVALDEREGEAGIRATLNLGHTFGHAVETGLGYGKWLHGEAVSLGMVMAVDMSVRLGWVDREVYSRTVGLLQRAGLPVALPEESGMDLEKFEATMSLDKKVSDGVLRLILLKGALGQCVFTSAYDVEVLRETIRAYC